MGVKRVILLQTIRNHFKKFQQNPRGTFNRVAVCSSAPISQFSTSCRNDGHFHHRIGVSNQTTGNLSQFTRNYSSIKLEDVELTSERYKDHVERGPYKYLTSEDVAFFRDLLGKHRVITDTDEIEGHNVDWLKMVRGASHLLLKPKNTEEVSAILAYCNEHNLAVVPQGGNTGLVGGSVPVFDEIILSTSLMNHIVSLDELSGVLVAEAGCILENLNEYLLKHDLIMPLDLGAKGSCQIGGNVSTNAGGLRLLRYGSLHSTVLGVEAVLADGTILDCLNTNKKDNTGYDLKHLFIGSEGTLGIVTKVAIHCPPKPNAVNLALLGLDSFDKLLNLFKMCKKDLCEILSSCEYVDAASMDCVTKNLNLKCPIGQHPFYMLIETSGSNGTHDGEKLSKFLEDVMQNGIVTDGTVAADSAQLGEIWGLRERIAESLMTDGYVYKYDLSIPLPTFDELVKDMRDHLGPKVVRVCGYGHLGDGNIHLNITSEKYDKEVVSKIEPFVYEWVANRRGSISAEHGVGFKKRDFISYSKSIPAITLMREMKKLFDPNNVLNPYKVLPTPHPNGNGNQEEDETVAGSL